MRIIPVLFLVHDITLFGTTIKILPIPVLTVLFVKLFICYVPPDNVILLNGVSVILTYVQRSSGASECSNPFIFNIVFREPINSKMYSTKF